jgi:hypothetical protein
LASFGLTEILLASLQLTIEAIYLTFGVDDALLTGVEGVAAGAYVGADLFASRTGMPGIATRTDQPGHPGNISDGYLLSSYHFLQLLNRHYADDLAAIANGLVNNNSVDDSEQSVIGANFHVETGFNAGAALANQNIAQNEPVHHRISLRPGAVTGCHDRCGLNRHLFCVPFLYPPIPFLPE